ncbi:unnamed protein product [Triticum turgidum subsp. durum]|uniref:Uncharacterized protein n=1 Tax=Triticum turgidum subsp. durum TaxID=4567 RepID=A0A9R1R0M9_TRITD|nr:unnamed protein product [Triticum turgidum subsp. durum]
MAMDQELPLGLGDFSIAMDASSLAALWPPTPLLPPDLQSAYQDQESSSSPWRGMQIVEEARRRLAAATAELEAAKEEVRRKEQSIAALLELVRRMADERDQLQHQVRQHLLLARELAAATTSSSSDSGASFPTFSPTAANPSTLLKASAAVEDRSAPVAIDDDRTAAVLEQLAAKRPLPQQGQLLQAVMEAGPLLENLLVAGPVPQWRDPPPVQPIPSPVISAPSGSRAPMGWGHGSSSSLFFSTHQRY